MTTTIRKRYGVVYTPEHIVELILDNVLPTDASTLANVAVCDPACGDGVFLVQFAKRALTDLNRNQALRVLRRMTGYDIDHNAIAKCKNNLDEILRAFYPNASVQWKVYKRNALQHSLFTNDYGQFTHIVGNPPYVRIQNLEQHRRNRMSQGWSLLRGATDLYIVFYELALNLLCDGGVLGFITPSSWIRSDSGALLRHRLIKSHKVDKIIDFGQYQMFKNVTTYSAILVVQKHGTTTNISLETFDGLTLNDGGKVVIDTLDPSNPWWLVTSQADLEHLDKLMQRGDRLGDIADIHVGIQTLADKVFIMSAETAKLMRLEPWMLHPIVKASVMKYGQDPVNRVVIFPYDKWGKLLPEEIIHRKAPHTYDWLKSNKQRLLSRDKGKIKPTKWYGFGRQVSLVSGFGDKILTSGMNRHPNFQQCPNPEATFYSGYCIKPKYPYTLDNLLNSLNSDEMDFFIKHTSRPYQGGWMSYAKSFIEKFPVAATSSGTN